jgi:hypothetical protein
MDALHAELVKADLVYETIKPLCAEIKETLKAYRRKTDDLIRSSTGAINAIEGRIDGPAPEFIEMRGEILGAFEHAKSLGCILAQLDSK